MSDADEYVRKLQRAPDPREGPLKFAEWPKCIGPSLGFLGSSLGFLPMRVCVN
jgi:hypothetical protein